MTVDEGAVEETKGIGKPFELVNGVLVLNQGAKATVKRTRWQLLLQRVRRMFLLA